MIRILKACPAIAFWPDNRKTVRYCCHLSAAFVYKNGSIYLLLFPLWREDGRRKEEHVLEKKISMLFDFQKFEKNADLQAVIDAVHARYAARKLTDEEAEYVAAAGTPDAALKQKHPKDEWQ